ncbi:MAG: HD family phosphohydrolase [Oscillospiraceae bacterium]|nr:HD family phosphohydrolase [Oscillospiraceae bacterium]
MIKALGSHLDLDSEEGYNSEYYSYVSDLLDSDVVCSMKEYIQHGGITTFQHCLNVSYYNYLICKLFSLDARAGARAGLLHDLFLYDWHTDKKPSHAYLHPRTALENAEKNFELSNMEKDIIAKHMYPVTITHFPKYRETWVIIMVDKWCALAETTLAIASKVRRLLSFRRSRIEF